MSAAISAIENASVTGRERPMPRLSKAITSKSRSSNEMKARPQALWLALIPWINSSGSPAPVRS